MSENPHTQPWKIDCPFCYAKAGYKCRSGVGKTGWGIANRDVSYYHRGRITAQWSAQLAWDAGYAAGYLEGTNDLGALVVKTVTEVTTPPLQEVS
jgi:hypothetical protein